MKAALCKSLDGPSGIAIEDVADPQPAAGEAVVRVTAAALNFLDTLITRGKYQTKPALPFSPAAEFAGIVEVAPAGADPAIGPGSRVFGYTGYGAAREKIAVPTDQLVPLPAAVPDDVGATLSVTYGTAIYGLRDRGRLRAGETVAVLGASGGAGLAAVEIAKLLGARVVACASSAEKLEVCRAHGADVTIDYKSEDLKQRLRDVTDGNGVDVVYDCVGAGYAEPAIRAMAWGGRFLVVGFAGGDIPRIPLNLLLLKSCELVGVFWGEATRRDPAGHRRNMADIANWVAAGRLRPLVSASFPLQSIGEAITALDRRTVTGKVVIRL